MSDLMNLIQEADLSMLDWESAKSDLENAKLNLELAKEKVEAAKQKFDAVLSRADEYAVPRAKLRKLVEERSQSLVASGLFTVPANAPVKAASPKAAPTKPKAGKKAAKAEATAIRDEDLAADQDFDFNGDPSEDRSEEAVHNH